MTKANHLSSEDATLWVSYSENAPERPAANLLNDAVALDFLFHLQNYNL